MTSSPCGPAAYNIAGFTDACVQRCIPGEEFFNHNHLGAAILPDAINHSEQHGEGQQQIWAGPD